MFHFHSQENSKSPNKEIIQDIFENLSRRKKLLNEINKMEQEVEKLGAGAPADTGQQHPVTVSVSLANDIINSESTVVESSLIDASASQENRPANSSPASTAKSEVPPLKESDTRKKQTPGPRSSGRCTSSPHFKGSSPPVVNGISENEYTSMVNLANKGLSVISPLSPDKGQNLTGKMSNEHIPKTAFHSPQNSKDARVKASGDVNNFSTPNFQPLNKLSVLTPELQNSSQASLQPQLSQRGFVTTSDDHSSGIQLLCDLLSQDGAIPGQVTPVATPAAVPPTTVMTPTSLATPAMSQTTEKRQLTSTYPPLPGRTSSPRRNKSSGRSATPKGNNANKMTGRKRNSQFSIDNIVNSNNDCEQPIKVSRLSPVSSADVEIAKSKTLSPFSIAHLTKNTASGSFYKADNPQCHASSTPSKETTLNSYANLCTSQVPTTSQAGLSGKSQSALGNLNNYVISASASIATKTLPIDVSAQNIPPVVTSQLDSTQRIKAPAPVKELPKDPPIGTTLTPSTSDRLLADLLPLVTYESLQGTKVGNSKSFSTKKNSVANKVPLLSPILPNLDSRVGSRQPTTLPVTTQQNTKIGNLCQQTQMILSNSRQVPVSSINNQQFLTSLVNSQPVAAMTVTGQRHLQQISSSQQTPTISTIATPLPSKGITSQNVDYVSQASEKLSSCSKQETTRESTSPDSEVRSLLSKETLPPSPLSFSPVQKGQPGEIESRPLVLVDSNPCSSRSPIQLPTSPATTEISSSLPSFGSVFSPNKERSVLPLNELR